MQDAFEMWIVHADVVHVLERVADVVDAGAADADALRDQARAALQVELAHVGRMLGVGDEGERPHGSLSDPHRDEPGLVNPPGHLAIPQTRERAAQARCIDAVSHAPARAAGAQPHDEPGLALRAAVARRENAQGAVVAVRAAGTFLRVLEAGRPHERAVAEDPEVSLRQPRGELTEGHCARTI